MAYNQLQIRIFTSLFTSIIEEKISIAASLYLILFLSKKRFTGQRYQDPRGAPFRRGGLLLLAPVTFKFLIFIILSFWIDLCCHRACVVVIKLQIAAD